MILVNKQEREILSSSAILKYVRDRGFENIVTYNNSYGESPFLYKDNKLYALMDDIEGERLELSDMGNVEKLAETIARFHNFSEGFIKPPEIRVKTEWGKSIEKYKTVARRAERYYKKLSQNGSPNAFERYTLKCMESLMNSAMASVRIFKSEGYLRVLEKSMIRKEICINSISDNTAVLWKENVILKDVFNLSYNMAIEDITRLIIRGSESVDLKTIYNGALDSYTGIRKLDENSLLIIKAIIGFPYYSLKTIDKYINGKSDENNLLEKFKRYYEKEQRVNVWRE